MSLHLHPATLCMRAAKAQASLRICTDSPEPSGCSLSAIIRTDVYCTCTGPRTLFVAKIRFKLEHDVQKLCILCQLSNILLNFCRFQIPTESKSIYEVLTENKIKQSHRKYSLCTISNACTPSCIQP